MDISVHQRWHFANILHTITKMITDFLRNEIGIITHSTMYVHHITVIIILNFHIYKRFDSIPEFPGFFFYELHLESKYYLMDFAFNVADEFRIWRYASQSFFSTILRISIPKHRFPTASFFSWLLIKGTGYFTGFFFFVEALTNCLLYVGNFFGNIVWKW